MHHSSSTSLGNSMQLLLFSYEQIKCPFRIILVWVMETFYNLANTVQVCWWDVASFISSWAGVMLKLKVPDGFENCRAWNYFHMKNTAIINTFRASLYQNLRPWLTHAICSSKRKLLQSWSEGFLECKLNKFHWNIDGLAQDCSNSIANALELLQSCAKVTSMVMITHCSPGDLSGGDFKYTLIGIRFS